MYVIVGATGFLGTYLIKNILEKTEDSVLAVARHPLSSVSNDQRVEWAVCDVASASSTEAFCSKYLCNSSNRAGGGGYKLIYLAAYHHPDLVEENPRIAWDVNVTALARFLNLAENVEHFLYPSTDSVYGESIGKYRFNETDRLSPVNRYGIQKSCAEKLVTAYGYHVARFPFLIGPSRIPSKKHFYDTIVETILRGNPIDMFSDSYRSALDFDTAAKLTIDILEKPAAEVPRIINICGDEALSKYEIGLRLADLTGVSRDLIRPISIQKETDIFAVKRASSTLMDNTLLKHVLGIDEVKMNLG